MTPPLVLHNPGWARAFEVFARMLGTPGRDESDPSQILAIIASLIFGFMFGDVGQGAVVFIAGLALARRVPLIRLLIPGGLMAMMFGVLFGSVFCREDLIPALWIRPLAAPITMLVVGIAAGMVVITIGLLLDAIQMHWRGEASHWWAHRAGLLIAYAGLLASPFRSEGLLVAALGTAWFIFGAALLATQARLSALAGAAGEFVEETLRLLVNTVSFARVGAFALAHAGLSVAVLEMATGERALRLLDRPRRRQCCDHRAGRLGGRHPDHAPAAVRILRPLPDRRRPRIQAVAAAGHREKRDFGAKPEGPSMKTNLKFPALLAGHGRDARGRRDIIAAADRCRPQRKASPARRQCRSRALGYDGGCARRGPCRARRRLRGRCRSAAPRSARWRRSRNCSAAF